MLAHNLTAHDFVNVALQRDHFSRELFHAIKRHHTDFSIFERHGVASVLVIHNAVQTNHLSRHLKPRDLVFPVFRDHAGFEKTGANGKKAGEFFTGSEKGAAPFDLAP